MVTEGVRVFANEAAWLRVTWFSCSVSASVMGSRCRAWLYAFCSAMLCRNSCSS